MTEQEAQEWRARLTRIWEPCHEAETECSFSPHGLEVHITIGPNVYVGFRKDSITLVRCDSERYINGHLQYRSDITRLLIHTPEGEPEFARCASEWLPFFRRGCWLSGCDIEASAHEKAEWMQGFTREELEVWNLKF